jgi:hypothetical protein
LKRLVIALLLVVSAAAFVATRHTSASAATAEAGDSSTVYYKLVNRASGRLLSALSGGTAEGTDCIVYDDVNASDQLWMIEDADQGFTKFVNKRSGRALSTTDGATANGTVVHLWHYLSTAPDQDWTIAPGTAGYVKITNRKRDTAALSMANSGTANNTRAELRDATGAADQDWKIVPVQTFDPNTSYRIVNHNARNDLSVYQGGTANNAIADIYPNVNQPDQLWHIVDVGGGYSHIVNAKSGRILSLLSGQTGNGTRAMIYDNVNATDQGWSIQPTPDGLYKLVNQRRPSGILSIVNAQTATEAPAQIWDDVNAADQTWQIIPTGNTVAVNALDVRAAQVSRTMTGSGMEDVNHEIYGGLYSQLVYGEFFQEPPVAAGVSGMWRPIGAGSFSLPTDSPYQGSQSQRITNSGTGPVGVENRGLNRWGINFTAGLAYEGYAYLRSPSSVPVTVSAQSASGAVYGSSTFTVSGNTWTKYPFGFTPNTTDPVGRLAITIASPGTVDLGYVFAQPSAAGRFQNLPVRKDIADAMSTQGVTVLRDGGSSVLVPGYRWKNMIGPREKRPSYAGTWTNKYESNGWGIFDFLNYAEALGVQGIPTFNIDETPQDMADLVDYLEAPTSNSWGARRAADGHPAPYQVKQIELGNENSVTDAFAQKFTALAGAIWAKDPNLVLTVGDNQYHDIITDPNHVTNGNVGSLSAYKTIVDFTAAHAGHLAIDMHIWTDGPEGVAHQLDAVASFDSWIQRYQPTLNYKIGIFELNANRHDVNRALGNAAAIGRLKAMGNRVSVVTSANALQPDGQNDDGWNQGLVFFDTHRSWLQPPGYVTQMIAADYLPTAIEATTANPSLSVTATTDGSALSVQVVNLSSAAQAPSINLAGYTPSTRTMRVTQLQGARTDQNNAGNVNQVRPTTATVGYTLNGSTFTYTFPPNSFTILRLG